MKTAALLPTPGDPYLIEHWLRNFEQTWRGEVDELRVLVNLQPLDAVREHIRERVEHFGGIYMETPDQVPYGHGYALRLLVDATDADIVMLCEDDCRVRYRTAVQQRLDRIKRGEVDVIGGPRTSMTNGITQACARKFPVDTCEGDGGHGFGMWPAFVFARRDCLLATDQNYGVRGWSMGEYVEPVDWVCPTDMEECADTFGWAAIQLRAKFRVASDVHFKGPWMWEEWLRRGRDIPWFHCGSLSSTGNLCVEDFEMPDAKPMDTGTDDEKEWGHRLYWLRRSFETTRDAFPEYADVYWRGWERLRTTKNVSMAAVEHWGPTIEQLVVWDEA